MSTAFINSIVIQVPHDLALKYAQSDDCHPIDPVANTLTLRIQPGSYQPRKQQRRDAKEGNSSLTLLISRPRYGFEATIADGRMEIFDCLEELDMRSLNNASGYSLITLLDYCKPHYTDGAIGYTVRTGYFENIEPSSGTVRAVETDFTSRRYGTGGKFVFIEGNRKS